MKVRFRREFGQDPFGGVEINLERVPHVGEYFQIGEGNKAYQVKSVRMVLIGWKEHYIVEV